MNAINISTLLVFIISCSLSSGFAPSTNNVVRGTNAVDSSTKLYFFGQPKDDGSPGDYVCKVSLFPFLFADTELAYLHVMKKRNERK